LLGLLVAVEERWIDAKVKDTVDKAIEEVEPFLPPSGVPDPIYSESGDGFFDEMRLTAPWKALEDPSDSPQVYSHLRLLGGPFLTLLDTSQ
jgi:hypothetical protein